MKHAIVLTTVVAGKVTTSIEDKFNTFEEAQKDLRNTLDIYYNPEQFHRGYEEEEAIPGWYDADGDLLITDADINSDNFRSFSLKNKTWEIMECLYTVIVDKVTVPQHRYTGEANQEVSYLNEQDSFVSEEEAREYISQHEPSIDCEGYFWYLKKGDETVEQDAVWF
jgi:hypothetical protein